MAGALRAEATLALANGLFIAFLLLGGIVIPVSHLPGPLATVASWLPAGGPRRRVPGGARVGRRGPRSVAGDPRGLGGRHDRPDRPDVPLGVAPGLASRRSRRTSRGGPSDGAYAASSTDAASGRSRRRSTGDPTIHSTPSDAATRRHEQRLADADRRPEQPAEDRPDRPDAVVDEAVRAVGARPERGPGSGRC